MNVSIVGLGNIGFYYDYKSDKIIQTLSKAFYKSKLFKLTCAIDSNSKSLRDFKLKYPNIKTSKNLKYLKKIKSEVLIVSTTTETHFKIIKDVLKIYRPKIIICEKPISYYLNSTLDIINICKEKKIKLFINYQRISNPIYIKIKNLITKDNNKFNLEINYSKGIYNNASHFINLILFLFGSFKKYKLLKKKRNKKDYIADFYLEKKNVIAKFKYSNKNSIRISGKNLYFYDELYKNKCFYKKKKIFSKKEFNSFFKENYQYYVIDNLEKFVQKKKFYLCDQKKAYRTEKLIDNILNL